MKPALFCVFLAVYAYAQPEKVIFDTDCAYFNDDGAALVMLLQRPKQVEIQALTIVPGNYWPAPGSEYMLHILKLMNRSDVPLLFGAQAPLVHTRAMAKKESGIDYLGAFAIDPPKFSGQVKAIEFLINTLEKSPRKVTILALGPMTNIAIMLRLRPDLASKIERLVFMGGKLNGREFNFWFDPEAAQIVLRSSIAKKVMFGLDICDRAPLDKKHNDEIAAGNSPITDLFRDDLKKNPGAHAYVWDCLAAGYLLDPSFVTKRETDYLDVDVRFGKNYGDVMPLDRSLAPEATPVEVMLDLNFERFFTLYKSLIH
jgi:inosine-uridine nucleoside N-ribohydrolase